MNNILLQRLLLERQTKNSGGIYHLTQIKLAYNSNRIEGTRLTEDETRSLYETRSILPDGKSAYRLDDMIVTVNHFRAFDYVLDHALEEITETAIKEIHCILFAGTAVTQDADFAIGEYKRFPNIIGAGTETAEPKEVPAAMRTLISRCRMHAGASVEDIIDFHARFEKIHPFQDGNGRVGRLLMFRECLRAGITPILIFDDMKEFYYRGLKMYPQEPGWLTDTCLSGQNRYGAYCERLLPRLSCSPEAQPDGPEL